MLNSSTSSTKSSTTTSRVAKTSSSQRLHHVTSSSSMSTSEMKALTLKQDLSDMQNSMSEISNLARTQPSIANDLKNSLQERFVLNYVIDIQ